MHIPHMAFSSSKYAKPFINWGINNRVVRYKNGNNLVEAVSVGEEMETPLRVRGKRK